MKTDKDQNQPKLVRHKFKADDPMVKVLIRKYSATDQIRGVYTEYEGEGEDRQIKSIELLIRE